MTLPLTGEALKHLRHDLRTPINHILGYTEILLEEYEEGGSDGIAKALREIHAGGRTLLDWIQSALGENFGSVSGGQLEAFEARLRPEAERLLIASESLAEGLLLAQGSQEALSDIDRVSTAFRRLLALVRETVRGPAAAVEAATSVPAAKAETGMV